MADRNTSGSEAKRPQLSDLRESGAIEQDADIVCFIHRPEYYKIFTDDKGNDLHGMAEIIVSKHRNGAIGDVLLRFRSEYARFQNPDDELVMPGPEPDRFKAVGSKMNKRKEGVLDIPLPPHIASNDPFGNLSPENNPPF